MARHYDPSQYDLTTPEELEAYEQYQNDLFDEWYPHEDYEKALDDILRVDEDKED